MTFSNHLIHCSSIGLIMTNKQGKTDTTNVKELSETAKNHLIECYISAKYNREKDIENKYIKKGLAVEEDSITLYSRVTKRFFYKNEETLKDYHLVGTPDIFVGQDIYHAQTIIDIKSSWDVFTFFTTKTKEINKAYYYQLQGYMSLTGAKDARLAYCLIDTPEVLINQEKERLLYKMGVLTRENPDYLAACDEIDRAMHFNDIPMKERVIEFVIQRDEDVIDKIHKRVDICRAWLNEFVGEEVAV